MQRIVFIDGNIGAGKSTFLAHLKARHEAAAAPPPKVIFMQEPIHIWETMTDGQYNILERFYQDQSQYAFSFQMFALLTRVQQLDETLRAHPDAIIVSERSILTDRHVFTKMLHDKRLITEMEWRIYNAYYEELTKKYHFSAQNVYLVTDPVASMARIAARARAGEERISAPYLAELESYHQDMFRGIHPTNINIDLLPLGSAAYERAIQYILDFIVYGRAPP